jgi:hypothetical protein
VEYYYRLRGAACHFFNFQDYQRNGKAQGHKARQEGRGKQITDGCSRRTAAGVDVAWRILRR